MHEPKGFRYGASRAVVWGSADASVLSRAWRGPSASCGSESGGLLAALQSAGRRARGEGAEPQLPGSRTLSAPGPPLLQRRLVCTFASWMRLIDRFVPVKMCRCECRGSLRVKPVENHPLAGYTELWECHRRCRRAASTVRGGGGGVADPGCTSCGIRHSAVTVILCKMSGTVWYLCLCQVEPPFEWSARFCLSMNCRS